jgi:hypothetical protein
LIDLLSVILTRSTLIARMRPRLLAHLGGLVRILLRLNLALVGGRFVGGYDRKVLRERRSPARQVWVWKIYAKQQARNGCR